EKRSGLHHVCVVVDDIEAALARMRERGVALIDEKPRVGAGGCRVAFVHPKAAGGVLLELKEQKGGASPVRCPRSRRPPRPCGRPGSARRPCARPPSPGASASCCRGTCGRSSPGRGAA